MLTTVDNPFDPFEQFTSWRLFDLEKGYNSCERLARFVELSDDLSEVEENEIIERAIDEIIKYDILNIYKKAVRKTNSNGNENEQTELNDSDNEP
jgi:hypothetical protein